MLVVGALTLLGLAVFDWFMKRDILAPGVLFCGMWGLTLLAVAISGSWYNPISPSAIAVYVYGGLAFCLGSWTVATLVHPTKHLDQTDVDETLATRSQLLPVGVLVGLELILAVPYIRGQLLVANGASWRVALQIIRVHSLILQAEGPASSLTPVANAPVVGLAAAVAGWYVRRVGPTGRLLAQVAVGVALVLDVLTGAKTGIVTLVVTLGALSALQSDTHALKQLSVGIMVGLIVFAIGTLLINFAFVHTAGLRGMAELAGLTTLDYWLGGPVAFSNVIAQPQAFESTQPLAAFFLNTAHSLGLRSSSPALHATFSAIGPSRVTNVYTVYFTYFKDHGWLGMIGLCALLGVVMTLLWRSSRRGAILPILFYALSVPSLLLSIQAEHFWTGLNQWIKLLVLLSLVFIPWKSNSDRVNSSCRKR